MARRKAAKKKAGEAQEAPKATIDINKKADVVVTTEDAEVWLTDRMMPYATKRGRECPKCKAIPTVCIMRRPGAEHRRCRICGHRWEVKG